MNTVLPGSCWLPALLSGIILTWVADGAPVTGRMTQKSGSLVDDFGKTLKLSRKLLRETRSLVHDYRLQKLPGAHLDFMGRSRTFPPVSIGIGFWLKLQAGDRLRLLNDALQIFPVYLDELAKWEKDETNDRSSDLNEKVINVRLDLRDLLHHIERQMSSLGSSPPKPLAPVGPPSNGNDWCSRVQMYQALRTLEQFLLRAVREYTMLQRFHG